MKNVDIFSLRSSNENNWNRVTIEPCLRSNKYNIFLACQAISLISWCRPWNAKGWKSLGYPRVPLTLRDSTSSLRDNKFTTLTPSPFSTATLHGPRSADVRATSGFFVGSGFIATGSDTRIAGNASHEIRPPNGYFVAELWLVLMRSRRR